MLKKVYGTLYLLCLLWYSKTVFKSASLPELYFKLASKRGIEVKDLRLLEKRCIQVVKKEIDVLFFETCLDLKVCPEFLKFTPPNLKAYGGKSTERLYQDVVKNQLHHVKEECKNAHAMLDAVWSPLKNKLSLMEGRCLMMLLEKQAKQIGERILDRHNKKLHALWLRQRPVSPDCVINNSSFPLSLHEKNALHFGLKHHILPKSLNLNQVKCNIESTINRATSLSGLQTDGAFRDDVKICLNAFANQCKQLCSGRANQALHKTLSQLSKNVKIKICKFDKGTGVTILDTDDYYSKLDNIVGDRTKFEEVPFNLEDTPPWLIKERSIQYYLRRYVKNNVDKEVYDKLLPSGSVPGKLYGTAKVHKNNTPIRPVNSMIGTSAYELAKWLDAYIKPNMPNQYLLSSTNEFLDKLRDYPIYPGDVHVSFDVESLFTNVPLAETITMIANKLYSPDAVVTPPVERETFCKLMKKSTEGLFLHRGKLYRQIEGVAMGSPLGPTLANFFLGTIEKALFEKHVDTHPKFYARYIDDVYAIFDDKQDYNVFFKTLNTLHPNLAFTVETTTDNLPFLDVDIRLLPSGVETNVYRKPTNTNVLLNYVAIAPLRMKKGLIHCLINRAHNICSSPSIFESEVAKLKDIFALNGYPRSLFYKVLENFKLSKIKTDDPLPLTESVNDTEFVLLKVPFLGKCSIDFGKKMAALIKDKFKVDTRIVFNTTKVGSFFSLKSPTPNIFRSNVVYCYTCVRDAYTHYVGVTTRTFWERMNEHLDPKRKDKSAVGAHLKVCSACRDSTNKIDYFKIIKQCRSPYEAIIVEALTIREQKPTLNKQLGKQQGAEFLLKVFH